MKPDLSFVGPLLNRAVEALETIAAAAKQMGDAAAVQQEMIQRALDASDGERASATVSHLRPVNGKHDND